MIDTRNDALFVSWPEFLHEAAATVHRWIRHETADVSGVAKIDWAHQGNQEDGIKIHFTEENQYEDTFPVLNVGEPVQYRGAHIQRTPELATQYDVACQKLYKMLAADGVAEPLPTPGAGVNQGESR